MELEDMLVVVVEVLEVEWKIVCPAENFVAPVKYPAEWRRKRAADSSAQREEYSIETVGLQ